MDDFYFDELNDLCGLGDIFPDIEPYLKDVTTTFENAKAESGKEKTDVHVEGSDSDSGISGDSFVTGALNNLDMSIINDFSSKRRNNEENNMSININLSNNLVLENYKNSDQINNERKNLVKVPTFVGLSGERTVLSIVRNLKDTNIVKPKQIVIKTHQSISKSDDNYKRESGNSMPKVTTVKILKNGEGYPIKVNQSFAVKNEDKPYYKYSKIGLQDINESYNDIQSNINKKDSISNNVSIKTLNRNIFLSDNSIKTNNSDYLKIQSNIFESKPLSLDMSGIDDFQSMDCSDTYYDMFQSSPTTDSTTLSSSGFTAYNNSNGIINNHQFDRMIKKQERMIKNRQAASLSRQRKKEYVERIEHKSELQKLEIQHLQNQVNEIKERFCALEQENQTNKRDVQMWRDRYYDLERQKITQVVSLNKPMLTKSIDTSSKGRAIKTTAASTTILGIFILLTFNFNSWSDMNYKVSLVPTRVVDIPIFTSSNDGVVERTTLKKRITGSESRVGRTLFSVMENTSLQDNSVSKDIYNQMCNNASGLNLTETKRLTLELNKWGSRYKADSVKEYDRIQNEKIKSQLLNKEIKSVYKKSKLRYYKNPNDKFKAFNSAELEVYHRNIGYNFLDSFFTDIDQKPDTLYFVSFYSDNLIYPATASKNYSTPKITLLLPADVRQDDETYYKMMKIECNVQNFTVVNLRKTKQP